MHGFPVKLSLILPSLFPAAMRRTIENLHATTRGVDYEILAVTPFEVVGPNVRWIHEETPKGAVHAHIEAKGGGAIRRRSSWQDVSADNCGGDSSRLARRGDIAAIFVPRYERGPPLSVSPRGSIGRSDDHLERRHRQDLVVDALVVAWRFSMVRRIAAGTDSGE